MTPSQIRIVVSSVFAMLAMGGRVQIKDTSLSAHSPGMQDHIISKGDRFLCVQKWEKASNKHTGQYCLVDLDQVKEGTKAIIEAQKRGTTTPRLRIATPDNCISHEKPVMLKVCHLKDKVYRRVHYSGRTLFPTKCFMQPSDTMQGHVITDEGKRIGKERHIPMLEVAVDYEACMGFNSLPDSERGTLSPTPTEAPVEEPAPSVEEEDEELPAVDRAEIEILPPSSSSRDQPAGFVPPAVHPWNKDYKAMFNKAAEELAATEEGDDDAVVPEKEDVDTVEFDNFDFNNVKAFWQAKEAGAN